MDLFTRSFLLLLVLLNPFVLSVYLLELVRSLDLRSFSRQLARAGAISLAVFTAFAWAGDGLFENVFQVRFFAFLIFGGIVFLIIGVRLIIRNEEPSLPAGQGGEGAAVAIATPFIIGPGTISASVLAGARLPFPLAVAAIGLALFAALAAMVLIKRLHDRVRRSHERLVRRYVQIAGRATALFTGSFAIDMILRGLEGWLAFMGFGNS
ncbi:MAG: MarC family protein [Vicinamibacterales bacterium]